MKQLRIVRLAEQFPPSQGGLAPGILALSLEQHRRGHQVTVITCQSPGIAEKDDEYPFPVLRLPCKSLVHLGWQACDLLKHNIERPDVIHCHGPAAAAVLLRKQRDDPPVVLTLHAVRRLQIGLYSQPDRFALDCSSGISVKNPSRQYRLWSPRVIWEFFLEQYMCKKADHLVLVASFFQCFVSKYYNITSNKCTVIYNGSDLHRSASANPQAGKDYLRIDRNERIILYVGRLDWTKRIHLLVQAMPMLLQRIKNVRLVLVGNGDHLEDLKGLVQKLKLESCITFLGYIEHGRLDDVYSASSCLCLPSIYEGLPKVILEAMSMNIPVVASDIFAHRDVLEGGAAGFLVEEPTPACWALVLHEVLTDAHEVEIRLQRATELIEQRYRWTHVADRLDNVYQQLAGV